MREYHFLRQGKWSDKKNWLRNIKPRWWHRPGKVFIAANCLLDCNTPRLVVVEQIGVAVLEIKPRKWFGLFRRTTTIHADVIGGNICSFVLNTTGELVIDGDITNLPDRPIQRDWSGEDCVGYGLINPNGAVTVSMNEEQEAYEKGLDLCYEIEACKKAIGKLTATIELIDNYISKQAAEIERMKEERNSDLYLEFGDGKILVLTSKDNKIILSKQHGRGEIGEKGPIKEGDIYIPSLNDIVMKFKNLAATWAVKTAVEDIEAALERQKGSE